MNTKDILDGMIPSTSSDGDDDIKNIVGPDQHVSRWPIFVFLGSAITCFLCSTLLHLFLHYSKTVQKNLSKLDYLGIAILIMGSCYPPYYYYFFCDFFWAKFYLAVITTLSALTIIVGSSNTFGTPRMRPIRASVYVVLGLSAGFPVFHILIGGIDPAFNALPVYMVAMGTIYISGAVLYARRWPESHYPEIFDIFGASHQIWHCMVFAAAFLHYIASLDAYYTRQVTPCVA